MNGSSLFIDTNIILYLLGGDKELADLLDQKKFHISFINEIELLGYPSITAKQQLHISNFLSECRITDINQDIKDEAIQIRKEYKLKLPDCIVLASARFLDLPFLTADSDFRKVDDPNVFVFKF